MLGSLANDLLGTRRDQTRGGGDCIVPTDSQHDGVQGGLAVGIGEMITTITALLSILIRLSNHLIHHRRF